MKSNMSSLDSVAALGENLDAGLQKCTKEQTQAEDKLALRIREQGNQILRNKEDGDKVFGEFEVQVER